VRGVSVDFVGVPAVGSAESAAAVLEAETGAGTGAVTCAGRSGVGVVAEGAGINGKHAVNRTRMGIVRRISRCMPLSWLVRVTPAPSSDDNTPQTKTAAEPGKKGGGDPQAFYGSATVG